MDHGSIVDDIQSQPAIVQVGGRYLGETFEEAVSLRSLSGRELSAVKATAEGEGLSVESMGANGVVRIRQQVAAVGRQTTNVRIVAQSEGRETILHVPVSYTGVAQ